LEHDEGQLQLAFVTEIGSFDVVHQPEQTTHISPSNESTYTSVTKLKK